MPIISLHEIKQFWINIWIWRGETHISTPKKIKVRHEFFRSSFFVFFVFRMGRVITRKKETRHLKEYVVVCHRHRKNKNLIKIHLKGRRTTNDDGIFLFFSLSREASHTHSEYSRADNNNNNNPSTLLYVSTTSSSAAAANYPTHTQSAWQRLSIKCVETTTRCCCFPATANIRDRVVNGKGCVRVCVCPCCVLFLFKTAPPSSVCVVLCGGLFKFSYLSLLLLHN